MSEYTINHAVSNIWCTPDQDNQFIFKLARLSAPYGVMNKFTVKWINFLLPLPLKRYHIFQIGEVHPVLVNLFEKSDKWVKMSDCVELTDTVINLYFENGINVPRYKCWYIYNEENVIYIAIENCKSIENVNFGTDEIYLRAYRNTFFNSERSSSIERNLFCYGDDCTDVSINDISDMYTEYTSKPGSVTIYCNGVVVPAVNRLYVRNGDTLEILYDSSVKRIVDFKVTDLHTFDSELDLKGKYLLHYDKQYAVDTIDYNDDIDLYLINSQTNKSIYLHKNDKTTFRNITYRDYSVNVSVISSYILQNSNLLNLDNLYIRMHIRHSGYKRNLLNDQCRVNELYKLSDQNIMRCMLGIDSTVDIWRAVNLEKSSYNKLISSKYSDINRDLVASAYGYHSCVNYFANPVVNTRTVGSSVVCDVPYLYIQNSTAFEYNSEGLLQSYKSHSSNEIYVCTNRDCKYVEFICAYGSSSLDETYGAEVVNLDTEYDYRFYVKQSLTETSDPKWIDETDSAKYLIVDNTLTWLVGRDHDTLVRSNKNFLIKTLNIDATDGNINFNISSWQTINSVYADRNIPVPLRQLDVFLNGRKLIKGLDYYLSWPTVRVVNKSYINTAQTFMQTIVYRCSGLCDKDLIMDDFDEAGYIVNSVVSTNAKYNIHDDKCSKIFVDGLLRTKDDIHFNEDGDYFVLQHDTNGKPYQLEACIVPLKRITSKDTYEFYNQAVKDDVQISDYLSSRIVQSQSQMLNPMLDYHYVFSPFMHKVMHDLKLDILDNTFFNTRHSDSDILQYLDSYLYLLKTDPVYEGNTPSTDFVKIAPHCYSATVQLTIQQYTFLQRVNKLLCHNLIDMTPYFSL